MRERISIVAVTAMAAVLFASPAAADKKHSREHDVAVQRCVAAYEAGAKAAHAPGSPTGAVRKHTMHRLAEEKKACIARAPR
jgi:hypothetical protein